MTDRLYSLEQLDYFSKNPENHMYMQDMAKQCADTMRENERLHDALRHIAMNCMGREAEAFAKNILHGKLPEFANYRYKDSDNG